MSLLDLLSGPGQGVIQAVELVVAFGLSALVGLEREVRGKSAGLRTQTIVGTSSALILLVSKYGFGDVLSDHVVLDPSRVAAQIVSGVGFLGAGLIITRQGAVRGLTTAAAVWEVAAIGMAAGAGLVLLAVVVTVLHFVIVLVFGPLVARLPGRLRRSLHLHVTYQDSRGVLRRLLAECSHRGWTLTALASEPPTLGGADTVGVMLTLTGRDLSGAVSTLGAVDGVTGVEVVDEESE
ncbi:MgtC/SapB family protein [Nocardioides mangrovicus]|uniref:MgtC/SapB family protein n=1 Tax=Nocardioides mangrovicus TaxID=2478913 RepID=A0A3L8NY02_9ACTN|nr:MgtC/SapB family protein [Nocardioides mangrovicus]RLV48020.1 MgtC/SapB family protein [Nocardioides mangrovicus]